MDNLSEEKLYDLLGQNTFESLTEEEQALVLQFLSSEEFTGLQTLNKAISGLNQSRKNSIEELLLNKLPKPKPVKAFWKNSIPIWQAASILILAIIGQLIWSNPNKKEAGLQTAMIDTIWVEKPIEKRISDTVYIWPSKTKSNHIKRTKAQDKQMNQAPENNQAAVKGSLSAPSSVGEHRNRINSLSLSKDSILLNIGFVKL